MNVRSVVVVGGGATVVGGLEATSDGEKMKFKSITRITFNAIELSTLLCFRSSSGKSIKLY